MRKMIYWNSISFEFYYALQQTYNYFTSYRIPDEPYLKRRFKNIQGYDLNLQNPKTLNEKLQWLKLNDKREINIRYADKYAVRDYIEETFGNDLLIPLLFFTSNHKDVNEHNIPNIPCIIKANHDSGSNFILRNKKDVNWRKLQVDCKWWLRRKYAFQGREWWYAEIAPKIIVEKLLTTQNGKVPNDYKLNCINGKVAFIYVSIDREGGNKRNIYDSNWNPLHFTWANPKKDIKALRGDEIDPPSNLQRMIEMAEVVAQQFPYVRVDFYDVDGRLYFGEITQCHGGGFDQMRPIEWDYKWGEMLNLTLLNK